ncbi:MAG: substrate-binding domain-containing protein [Bacillota bacterium]|nr:substrate-binding domain-containing protein [Bacillota bacterium]
MCDILSNRRDSFAAREVLHVKEERAGALRNRLRQQRLAAGLSQQELARRAGLSRQTVSGLEAGRYAPGVEAALRLARALACRVEDLFSLEEAAEPLEAEMPGGRRGERVVLGRLGGRWIARRLEGLGDRRWSSVAAHGVVEERSGRRVRVRRLAAGEALFLAGCDPALGLLASHVARGAAGLEAFWWEAGNGAALRELRAGRVHAALVHRGSRAEAGAPEPPPGAAGFLLARWPMGWFVRRGNPSGFRGAGDLVRLRLVNRERGSGARALLDRLLAEAGVAPAQVRGYGDEVAGHWEAAARVAAGLADVALGAAAAAEAWGLDFLPVEEQRSELWLPREALEEPWAEPLLETLASGPFLRELAFFGPYDTREVGRRA